MGAARTELYLNGIAIQSDENDPRPVIAVDITENIPSVVGSTVAHEISHWMGHFTTNNTDAEEFDHLLVVQIVEHFDMIILCTLAAIAITFF